ncbi:sugar fermentation stimulation protein A [Clostridium cavendishii DSM 21758]|uniref:Sugar fermentation stimulation protein homolog n=1 Tax=Clostridium cavendishii DSM 21758 TaxID=1121302 RepID=A0A1M6QKU8_9CLOT|nr:DNA/RNA nuclease SfsA [Clostridium cavendishii]SHK20846.1 sugar fermentation stimulation protein A [Clostridium cavendishii DSM 21758]
MNYNKNIIEAKFIYRPNRFEAIVELNGEEIIVHVPNTGRCKEILVPNSKVYLREESNPNRKTGYDLIAAYKNNELINIDSQIPNKVVDEALRASKISELKIYKTILREKTFGKSRFDFKLLSDDNQIYYLEVKGVTLENNKVVSFPDAPTERGTKHILELIEVKRQKMGAGILLLIQLQNVKYFTPNYEMDPKFAEALKLAKNFGVDILAYNCKVCKESIELLEPVKVIL